MVSSRGLAERCPAWIRARWRIPLGAQGIGKQLADVMILDGGGMTAGASFEASCNPSCFQCSLAGTERPARRSRAQALKSDGSVVVWGNPDYGGEPGGAQPSLQSNVKQISSTYGAFAAAARSSWQESVV